MTSREFAEWVAYERWDPGDPERSDLRAAQICSTLANINRKPRSKPFKPEDFMLQFKPPTPAAPETVYTKLMAWAKAHNAKWRKAHPHGSSEHRGDSRSPAAENNPVREGHHKVRKKTHTS